MVRIFLVCALLCSFSLEALRFRGPHRYTIGPEMFYTYRTRDGGSWQDGAVAGGQIKYERFRRSALYWAALYTAGYGELSGEDGGGDPIRSRLFQQDAEGRLGYNFQWKNSWKPYILPFVGYGYFFQRNSFMNNAPVQINLTNQFCYTALGLQWGFNLTRYTTFSFLGKADWMVDGTQELSGAAVDERVTLSMEEKWQFTIELPIEHHRRLDRCCLFLVATPFMRLRHYGGMAGFPFDFAETRFREFGARISVGYDF